MADNILVMPTEQEVIQHQIDESRAALTDKLERLEGKVTETVQAATASVAEATASVVETVNNATASVSETVGNVNAAVQGTVETVKNSVSETVASVKETFDLQEQVRRYPWRMFAGAIALGYVGGRAAGSVRNSNQCLPGSGVFNSNSGERTQSSSVAAFNGLNRLSQRNGFHTDVEAAESRPVSMATATSGWTDYFGDAFGAEIAKLRGLAIGTSLGLVRDMISNSAPETLRTQIAEVVDGFTQKLGGQRIQGEVLPSG